MTEFWIGVAARVHVRLGIAGGFAQFSHGKEAPLRRVHAGDGLAYYSPRTDFPEGEPLQAFTAIGLVETGQIYQVEAGGGFRPYRIDVRYLEAGEASIRPLLDRLSFIRDKAHWGAPFRFGQLKISASDFKVIASAMGRDFDQDFAAVAAWAPEAPT